MIIPVLLIFAGCEREKEPAPLDCDPNQTITYTNTIQAVLTNNCMNCHSNGGTSPNLDTYAKVFANRDLLLLAINHKQGAKPMPQGASKLDAATLKKFDCWKEQGFKQ